MTLRAPIGPLAAVLGAALTSVLAGLLISTDRLFVPVALALLVAFLVVAAVNESLLLSLLVVSALLQPPLGSIGPFPELKLAEILVPSLLLLVLIRQSAAPDAAGARLDPPPREVRVVHVAVAAYAAVLALNLLRSKYLMVTDQGAGVDRAFYDYFVAIGVYPLVYGALRSGRLSTRSLFRLCYAVALVVSVAGVAAVVLGLPLNFGGLRYSVYDYAAGGVRVGFLETVGIVGLAVVAVRAAGHPATAVVFAAAVFASGGRAAAVGAVVAVAAYLFVTRRSAYLVVAAIVAALAVQAFPPLQQNAQVQRLSNIGGQEFEADGRAYIYRESLRAYAANPVFGTGIGVPTVTYDPNPEIAEFYEAQLEIGGHATYVSLLKNLGPLGLVPFLVALLATAWGLGRAARGSRAAGFFFVVLVAQMVSMVAGGNGSDPFLFLALGGGAAVLASPRLGQPERGRAEIQT
ncbi:MAG TPA: O-antigen ligase family protein [Thermoleophilaceae bacterium]|jgi:O-antigen ligase